MEKLMLLAAGNLSRGNLVSDRLLDWPGDPSPGADSVPLRWAGALHALKLSGIALTDVYSPHHVGDDQLWLAVERAMEDHADAILAWLDDPPQTNEVRRAAALLPALALVHREFGMPIELLELGTSAGLNLRADLFRLDLPGGYLGAPDSRIRLRPDWTGPLPPLVLPPIVHRAGVDRSPLDPKRGRDRLRLLSYLWPDQPDRIERTQAAIELAMRVPADIASDDAGRWLERTLAKPSSGRLRVVFHTVAWQYFSAETRGRALAAFETVREEAVQIAMEYDGGNGAAVTLTIWPQGDTREIARSDFHGRWIVWLGGNGPSGPDTDKP